MMLEVLAYVAEGWKPLYLIDVKKFDKTDNTIPVDGYAEIINGDPNNLVLSTMEDFEAPRTVYEFKGHDSINRDFIIRAKRLKGDEWKVMKYKIYKETE